MNEKVSGMPGVGRRNAFDTIFNTELCTVWLLLLLFFGGMCVCFSFGSCLGWLIGLGFGFCGFCFFLCSLI